MPERSWCVPSRHPPPVSTARKNASAAEGIGAAPFAPFRSNSLPPAEDSAWARACHVFVFDHEESLAHYHRRSSVELVLPVVETKFRDSVSSKSDDAQVNEALCKILSHNVCALNRAAYPSGVEASFAPDDAAYTPVR